MNTKNLSDGQIENLLELVEELKLKVKKKQEQLTSTRQRLNKAKSTIQRLQSTVTFQRERILDLHRGELLNAVAS